MANIFETKLEELNSYAETKEIELANLKELLVSKHKYEEAKTINEVIIIIQKLKKITTK